MKKYDIIVVGGGFSGVMAAMATAREGLNTLLVEKGNALGGAAVNMLVNPFMDYFINLNHNDDEWPKLSRGLFLQCVSELKKRNAILRNIVFDETAGIFHVKYPFLYSVGLKGEGVYHAMMKKALERNGIRAVKSGTKYYIEALEGIYRLMSNGVPVATSLTVEEMLCRIQSLKPLL